MLLLYLLGGRFYYVVPSPGFLVFHNSVEIFSIVVSLSIFGIGWISFEQSKDRQSLFLSASFLAIGLIDLAHTFGYPGMPPLITPNSGNKSSLLWLCARLFTAASLLGSAFIRPAQQGSWLGKGPLLAAALTIAAASFTFVIFFPDTFPTAFVTGQGQTLFKIATEWVIILTLLLAVIAYRRMAEEGAETRYYLCAFILCIFSEIAFTSYRSTYDIYNVLGHIYKTVAFALIYRGIFVRTINRPYRELSQALNSLNSQSNLLQQVMNSVPQAIFWKDRDGVYLGCNRPFAKNAGLDDTSEIVGKTDYDLPWTGEEADKYRSDDLAVVANREIKVHVTESLSRADGEVIWIDTWKMPLVDSATGEVRGVLGIYEDITFRVQQEALLQEAEQLNQEIVTSAREGIVVYDLQLRIRTWNPFMEEITGLPAAEVLGKHPLEIFACLGEAAMSQRLAKALRGEAVAVAEFPFAVEATGKSGWVSDASSTLRNASGEIVGVLGTVRDITAQRAVEEQLLQAQKLESLGRLAGGVAHDFNNKLTVIMGCADLAREAPDAEKLQEYLVEILRAGEQSRDITSQMLAFSRQQSASPRPLSLNVILRDLVKSLKRLIGEDIRTDLLPGEGLWMVNIDPVQLDQVIMNLTVNARDAMERGGTITIETANAVIDADRGLLHGAAPGQYVRLTFSDTGSGMTEETRKHIFEPFFTTKEQGKGTGLGLATIYGIVTQNGGFIDVESRVGSGTTFVIHIPRHLGTAAADAAAAEQGAPPGSGRILLVEDDEPVRAITASMLTSLGYCCLVADTPHHALELARDPEIAIDLVLTDIVMPGINGVEMMAQIEAIRPGIKSVFMSGYSPDHVFRSPLHPPLFIKKPFRAQDIAPVLSAALGN